MAKYIYLSKNANNLLEAADVTSEEYLNKIAVHEVLKVQISSAVNHKLFNKMWVLLNFVFDNQDTYDVKEYFIDEIKLRVGHYRQHVTAKGNTVYIPKSFGIEEFEKPDEEGKAGDERLKEIINRIINISIKYFIDTTKDDLVNQLIRF